MVILYILAAFGWWLYSLIDFTKKEHASKTASDNHQNIKKRDKKYAIKVGRIKDDINQLT